MRLLTPRASSPPPPKKKDNTLSDEVFTMVPEPWGRTQSHSLLKPPLATFRVDTVKEDSSRLFQLISDHASTQTFDSKEFYSQSVEA